MCNVSCEKALPFGRAKRDARERASESGWGEEPFVVNTISCGTFAVTVFTLCRVPRFPGGIENLWVIVASSPFSPSPPALAFRFRVSSRASIFHDIPKWRACLQAKCNVQRADTYNIVMLYIQQKSLKTSFTFLSVMVMLDWILFPVSTASFGFSLWQFVMLILCHFPCSSHRRETLSEKNRNASFFI